MSNQPASKTIIRTPKTSDFFSMARAVAQDRTLSWEAHGILDYLLSKPDNWVVQPTDLERPGCKRDKVYRILRELCDSGYITRERAFDTSHRIAGLIYQVHEKPTVKPTAKPKKPHKQAEKPHTAFPDTEIPDTEKPHLTYNRVLQNTEGKQKTDSLLPPSATTKKSPPSEKLDKNLLSGMRTPTPIRVPNVSPKLPPPKPIAKPVPKPTPKPAQKKGRKPQPSDVLWNAIADCFFDGARVGNQRLGRILHGQDSHGLFGLIAFEVEHQNTQTLDFEMLAFLVPKFKESLPDDPKRTDSRGKPMKLELRDPAKFIERWIGWRCTTPNGHTSEPPMMNYDPACPHGCDKGIVYFTDEKGQTATRYCTCRVKILEARKGRVL